MFNNSEYVLAVLYILAALLLLGLVWILLRSARRLRPILQARPPVDLPVTPAETHTDAVIVVQAGGRVMSINAAARQLFGLQPGESANLERLARRLRPSEPFINLCAAEGQARFVLEGKALQGVSYKLALEPEPVVVVSLRAPGEESRSGGSAALQKLQNAPSFLAAMSADMDIDATILAILQSVDRLIDSDVVEMTIWDAGKEHLTPYRMVATPGAEPRLDKPTQRYRMGEGFSGQLIREKQPLLITDTTTRPELRQAADPVSFPLRSYVGMPLLVGSEFIGTLELGAVTRGNFQQEDLELLQLLAPQAAVAIHNTLLYNRERYRTAELAGLAGLAQAFTTVSDPSSLFDRLLKSISPLIPVQILGFLLYNETTRRLEGQAPIIGLPEQFMDLYNTEVAPDSPLEKALLDQDLIITGNAMEDPQWQVLGIDQLARGASLRDTALIPLNASGHTLGYLQASNHTDGGVTFTQDELHLLLIVANQAASIIENSRLVQQSRLRAQRAEALRRITGLASSAATLDEIFQYSLQELARLLHSDLGLAFVLDQNRKQLSLLQSAVIGELPDLPERSRTLLVEDAQFAFTVTGAQSTINTPELTAETAIIPFYQQIFKAAGVQALLGVPLVVRDEGVGELWFASRTPDSFNQADVQVLTTAAGQLAGVVEQAFLVAQTDASLRRRVEQMTALTRISRELSTSLDLQSLLQLVYSEALRTTRADCGTITLFDLSRPEAETPRSRFSVGDPVGRELSALELKVLAQAQPLNLPDVTAETGCIPSHEGIASAMIVPVIYRQRPAGLITLHGKTPARFDEDAVEIAKSLAAQAAIALGNAFQFEEESRRGELLRRQVDTIGKLFQVSKVMRPGQNVEEALTAIANAISETSRFKFVVISSVDNAAGTMRRLANAGHPPEVWAEMRTRRNPWNVVETLCQPEFRFGSCFFIPADRRPVVTQDVHFVSMLPAEETHEQDAWDTKDLLFVPLYDAEGLPLGLVSVDGPVDGRRPDRPTLEALELLSMQVGVVLENSRLNQALQERTEDLQTRTDRLEAALSGAQQSLPLLLNRHLEQTITIQSLHRQNQRVQDGLALTEQVTTQNDAPSLLRTLARQILTRFDLQTALIGERLGSELHIVEVIGAAPAGANPQALFGQKNPLRQALQDGQPLLVSMLEREPEWKNIPLLNAFAAQSFIALPLPVTEDRSLALLAIGTDSLPEFTTEDRQSYARLIRQVTISLQNLELLTETRRRLNEMNLLLDFSRKLGSLDPASILKALLENAREAIPVGTAGWVGLLNKEGQLEPLAASGYADSDALLEMRFPLEVSGRSLPVSAFRANQPLRIGELNFVQEYTLSSDDLLRYRRATGGGLPIAALATPIGLGEHALGVLVLENFTTPDAFIPEDEGVTQSLSQQAALALDNARLLQSAEQRAAQLQALTEVAGTITSSLQTNDLIASLLDQLGAVIPYNTATLWLRSGSDVTVAAASGFADNESRLGLSARVEDSLLFQSMIATAQPISVPDVREDVRFPSLLEPDHFSWLGIPLLAKGQVIGLIALEKTEPGFYTPEHIQGATTFAGQAAVGLENARLFEESVRRAGELDQRSQRLALLNRLSSELGASLDVDYILKITCQQLLSAMGANRVGAVMLGDGGRLTLQVEVPGAGERLPRQLPATPLFTRLIESQGLFSTADAAAEADLLPIYETYLSQRHTRSLLIVPLMTGSTLHGWLLVQSVEVYRYSLPELELARTISNQAAIAIQNARLFLETTRLKEDLERRVEERTAELSREHRNSQTLLKISTELSASLDLDQVLVRTLSVLNESISAEQSLIVLTARPQKYSAGESLVDVAALTSDSPEQQVAKWVVKRRSAAVIDDIATDARWQFPADHPFAYKSALAIPLTLGEDVLGALMIFHRQGSFFILEQIGLLEAAVRQISIALNNAELFNLIRDQSENLGGMLREQQMEASRSRSILEAVADGVVVTDASGAVTLFNPSAERILDLKADDVLKRPLSQFVGLFGHAAGAWFATIRTWSQNPATYQPGDIYSEQMDLDNGRVVSVNLAPVFWRSQLLGTVSTFRDITHEVQVDRLKSEFVANVSHELRTPMTSIKGYVEIMLMGATGELNAQQKHFLQVVKGSTERLTILINDLLDLSRVETGRVTLAMQSLDLNTIARMVVDEMQARSESENRPMTFTLDIPADLPPVLGDAERVQQILANLVRNGYIYTPPGGEVQIHMKALDGEVQVDVVDNGIGILSENQHRIFERFYRGDDPLVLASAGTGLGLAMAKTLVEMHHGRIWFASAGVSGEGSVFSFTLPVYTQEEA
jgi:PAS domain S-box-containing protein